MRRVVYATLLGLALWYVLTANWPPDIASVPVP
jgi:hypothetical protein